MKIGNRVLIVRECPTLVGMDQKLGSSVAAKRKADGMIGSHDIIINMWDRVSWSCGKVFILKYWDAKKERWAVCECQVETLEERLNKLREACKYNDLADVCVCGHSNQRHTSKGDAVFMWEPNKGQRICYKRCGCLDYKKEEGC